MKKYVEYNWLQLSNDLSCIMMMVKSILNKIKG